MARNRILIIRDWSGHSKKYITLIGHIFYWEQLTKDLGIQIDRTDAIKSDLWKKYYFVNIDSFKNTGPPVHSQVNIYTDGSKTDDHVGSGYVIYHKNEEIATDSKRLADEITVYQVEVNAIKQAASTLLQNKPDHYKFVKIFSDSQAAIRALAA